MISGVRKRRTYSLYGENWFPVKKGATTRDDDWLIRSRWYNGNASLHQERLFVDCLRERKENIFFIHPTYSTSFVELSLALDSIFIRRKLVKKTICYNWNQMSIALDEEW